MSDTVVWSPENGTFEKVPDSAARDAAIRRIVESVTDDAPANIAVEQERRRSRLRWSLAN